MSPRRYYAQRRDEHEADHVEYLRARGATVCRLYPGPKEGGLPDLLVGYRGVSGLAEDKRDGGDLSDRQVDWLQAWRGGPVFLLRTEMDCQRMLNVLAKRAEGCARLASLEARLRAVEEERDALETWQMEQLERG